MNEVSKNHAEAPQGAAASLLNGLRVLEAFRVDDAALGVTEVAQRVGLHKSTVSRILAGLAEAGYVQRDPGTGRYRLGLGVISLAGPLLAELDVRRLAREGLEELTAQLRETSALCVWNGAEAIVVEQIPSPQYVKHTAYIGTRFNRWESSSVRLFLAHIAPEAMTQLLDSGRITRDEAPLRGSDVQSHLHRIRTEGYALNDGRTDPQELGISVPVHDYDGAVVGCVTLSAPRARIDTEDIPHLVAVVRDAARRITERFGGAQVVDATGVRGEIVGND